MSKLCYVLDVILIGSIGILLCQYSLSQDRVFSSNKDKYLPSRYLVYDDVKIADDVALEEEEEKETEEIIVPSVDDTVVNDTSVSDTDIVVQPSTPSINQSDVVETLVGSMSGYGPDCKGCSSHTASGYDISNGNIYYNDSVYGKLRVLAGDNKYPFYTIVRISNSGISQEPLLGIVLDRGGMIGLGGKYLFDLLYPSEKEASVFGVSKNVTFEILRMGLG